MSNDDARAELAGIAASLRAYLEWQVDCGSSGIPRRPRAAASTSVEASPRAPTPRVDPSTSPSTSTSTTGPSSILRDPNPPGSLPIPSEALTPITLSDVPPPVSRGKTAPPPPMPPSVIHARELPVIQAEVAACTKCALHETRTNTVFSRGNPDAKLCFVGEAPGADEDAQGLPFVGRAGQLLDKMIVAMGLDPAQDVYVCNIIKCRPPGNRRPEPEETATCIPYLHEQLAKVEPKVIVALGNTSVAALLGTKLGITKVRGSWKLYRGKIPVMPTYHPSYLLRPSPQQSEAKRQTWEDLQAVMKELGLSKPKP
jgi:uracil-DNA glycosylase family 4